MLVLISTVILLAVATVLADGQSCVLPPYPLHGHYTVATEPDAVPGKAFDSVFFTSTCDPGYHVEGNSYAFCAQGYWDNEVTQCQHCGSVTVDDKAGTVDSDVRKEAPWHVALYESIPPNANVIFTQTCAGTLISASTVISAAQCVWWSAHERTNPPDIVFAAVGSTQRTLNLTDPNVQKSMVKRMRVPFTFTGRWSNYQDDIAILVLVTPFEFNARVKPACIDFDLTMERRHLTNGTLGKVAVWHGNDTDTTPFQVLNITSIETDYCYWAATSSLGQSLTSDKICGLFQNETLVPSHSLGAGVVFPEVIDGVTYYYLRGVVATIPSQFNISSWVALTRVQVHDLLIARNILY